METGMTSPGIVKRITLETFLRGMETAVREQFSGRMLRLETFLRGMETRYSAVLHDAYSQP